MNRRELLRLLATGLVGHTLDIDKLLWVPGAKTFFIPEIKRLTNAEIISIEWARVSKDVKVLFERDSKFYDALFYNTVTSSRMMKVPMKLEEK